MTEPYLPPAIARELEKQEEAERRAAASSAATDEHAETPSGEASAQQESNSAQKSQATTLVELAADAELFHTPDGEPYASIEIGGHLETWALKSRGFQDWLTRLFYKAQGKSPSTQGFKDALGVMSGRARFDGVTREVHVRVAAFERAVYVDLADVEWRAVEITVEGWRVIESKLAPVRFRRTRGMLPLPVPTRGGSLAELRRFINIRSDYDRVLVLAWLVATLRPGYPLPLLALYGAQGTAKSTTARLLASLVDPVKAALRSEPRNEHDLMIGAHNRWCLAYDNLSHLPASLSDALCRLATGGGLSTRQLYTDDEEMLFEALRPAIINGIEDLATRGDLLSRAVVIYLSAIEPGARRRESDLWREFEQARPSICGALFDAVSVALSRVETVELDDLPRMADFAAWAVAAEPAFGVPEGTFLKAYADNRAAANATALGESPLSEAVMSFLDGQPDLTWSGTATELHNALDEHVSEQTLRHKSWPKAANALTNKLRRLGPALREAGIKFEENRDKDEKGVKIIRLEKLEKRSSASPGSPGVV